MKKKKYAIILICLLVIAIAIIAINIRIPKRISITICYKGERWSKTENR